MAVGYFAECVVVLSVSTFVSTILSFVSVFASTDRGGASFPSCVFSNRWGVFVIRGTRGYYGCLVVHLVYTVLCCVVLYYLGS